MSVAREEVLRIAALARLRLEDDALERMTVDLNSILEHVSVLETLDEASVATEGEPEPEPVASTRAGEGTDEGEPKLDPATFAPAWQDGFFVVPPPPGVVRAEGDGS
ncbi:MAG: Asp-tRNA(Asn)/Glu-tRNA(Gln) amidotransferase subunit GatC [Gemmatimonadota bacterium]|nr:Asp-tRNA(Asn)/Glu-tRNA(Gln) amidotransferase subunit GatC [Gemmatimonadota bacterium]